MVELKIEDIYPKATVNPIIFTFRNGYTNDNFKESECYLFSDEYSQPKKVVTKLNDMVYTGDELSDDLSNTYLLVRDTLTNKVRVIETSSVELKPELQDNFKKSEYQDTSFLELSKQFGSKKQIRTVEAREKLKVNSTVVDGQIKKARLNIKTQKLDTAAYSANNSEEIYIPPINRDANSVEEVFPINKILTEDEYNRIYAEIENQKLDSELIPFMEQIFSTRTLNPKHKVLGLYANCLFKMYNLTSKEICKKSFVICNVSCSLNELVLTQFSLIANGRRNRPTQLKDKALCHAVVFSLIINNFNLELVELAKAVKMSLLTTSSKVRGIGAHVVTVGSRKLVQLKLPLNVPSSFKRRKTAAF